MGGMDRNWEGLIQKENVPSPQKREDLSLESLDMFSHWKKKKTTYASSRILEIGKMLESIVRVGGPSKIDLGTLYLGNTNSRN